MSSPSGPESQDALFHQTKTGPESIPPTLARAAQRLQFPPSYVVVGVYRLFTDKALYIPAWEKCKHGTLRGLVVAIAWTTLTFGIQRRFIQIFLSKSPRIVGLSGETIFGYKIPFNIHTYAAMLLVGSQATFILRFFLSRNIRIARERAWAYTVASRGKGSDFWQPYVEEWECPPIVDESRLGMLRKLLNGLFGKVAVRVLLLSFSLYPFVGVLVAAWFKAAGTSRYLHKQYFESKKMTNHQVAVFIEERKWDYRAFGFVAALFEGLPVVGLIFSISNRVGAAMWAHDLEKRQHFVAAQQLLSSSNKPDSSHISA